MYQVTLPDLVRRRFIHCVNVHGNSVSEFLVGTSIPPRDLCKVIAGQRLSDLPLTTHFRISQWLNMSLANVVAIAHFHPTIADIARFGMQVKGYNPGSSSDQIKAAAEAGISIAVFRRALHGYASFKPSIQTCERFAQWLFWTGFSVEDMALSAGRIVHYYADGRSITRALSPDDSTVSYPCACGRPGCVVPPHIPIGPKRKWRNDACRMWNKRQLEKTSRLPYSTRATTPPALSQPSLVRFITINERLVPVRF